MITGSVDMPLDPAKATIEDAERILQHLGSNHDPIYYKGEETCVSDLACEIPNTKLKDIKIGYHTKGRRVRNGTLTGMIKDRGGAEQAAENAKWPVFRATIFYDR